jgi:hypothetical protein
MSKGGPRVLHVYGLISGRKHSFFRWVETSVAGAASEKGNEVARSFLDTCEINSFGITVVFDLRRLHRLQPRRTVHRWWKKGTEYGKKHIYFNNG